MMKVTWKSLILAPERNLDSMLSLPLHRVWKAPSFAADRILAPCQ